MAGFEPRFTDIVDYIVRITDEIWTDRAIGYIRDTYDHACTVYSSYGVVRSAEAVVKSTIAGIAAVPDGDTNHLNVAWSGDEEQGFYTAHLGFGGGVNRVDTTFGPATGPKQTKNNNRSLMAITHPSYHYPNCFNKKDYNKLTNGPLLH